MFEEQSIDQSALKKLTEELSRTKKSEKGKGSGGERACKYYSIVFALALDLF